MQFDPTRSSGGSESISPIQKGYQKTHDSIKRRCQNKTGLPRTFKMDAPPRKGASLWIGRLSAAGGRVGTALTTIGVLSGGALAPIGVTILSVSVFSSAALAAHEAHKSGKGFQGTLSAAGKGALRALPGRAELHATKRIAFSAAKLVGALVTVAFSRETARGLASSAGEDIGRAAAHLESIKYETDLKAAGRANEEGYEIVEDGNLREEPTSVADTGSTPRAAVTYDDLIGTATLRAQRAFSKSTEPDKSKRTDAAAKAFIQELIRHKSTFLEGQNSLYRKSYDQWLTEANNYFRADLPPGETKLTRDQLFAGIAGHTDRDNFSELLEASRFPSQKPPLPPIPQPPQQNQPPLPDLPPRE